LHVRLHSKTTCICPPYSLPHFPLNLPALFLLFAEIFFTAVARFVAFDVGGSNLRDFLHFPVSQFVPHGFSPANRSAGVVWGIPRNDFCRSARRFSGANLLGETRFLRSFCLSAGRATDGGGDSKPWEGKNRFANRVWGGVLLWCFRFRNRQKPWFGAKRIRVV